MQYKNLHINRRVKQSWQQTDAYLCSSFHLPRSQQDSRTCSYLLCSYTWRSCGTHCQLYIHLHLNTRICQVMLIYFHLISFAACTFYLKCWSIKTDIVLILILAVIPDYRMRPDNRRSKIKATAAKSTKC